MKEYKKLIGVLLSFVLLIGVFPTDFAFAAKKTKIYDDVAGHPYEEALLYVIKEGLMSNTKSKIYPNSLLTKGAACLSINALLKATVQYERMDEVKNLKIGDKYYNTISIGLNGGYLKQKKNKDVYSPLAKATYGYIADIFSDALGIDMKEVIIGKHKAKDTLTRAEFAVLLQKIAPNIVRHNTKKDFTGDVYVTAPNIKLLNSTINGNLIITDAVGNQEVTLRNVTVKGKLIVRGGGENSVIIMGNSNVSEVIVKQVNNKVSLKVVGDAQVKMIYINDGSNDVIVEGCVGTLTIVGDDINVSLNKAEVGSAVLSGKNTSLAIASNSEVGLVSLEESAQEAKVSVSGEVANILSAAQDSKVVVNAGGIVTDIVAEKSAAGISVEAKESAVIRTVESKADDTVVTGNGKVASVDLQGNNSNVTTKETDTSKPEVTKVPTVTVSPTVTLTPRPTANPMPTTVPNPTVKPTTAPTPTVKPTTVPTPTVKPTTAPTPTIKPTTAPTPTIKPVGKDDRFEEGYPKIIFNEDTEVGNDKVKVVVKLKEGVATEENPAEVYSLLATSNSSFYATTMSVLHGHLGENTETSKNHSMIYADDSVYLRLTDAKEYTYELRVSNTNFDMDVYFVIKQDDKITEVPVLLSFDADTTSSVVNPSNPEVPYVYDHEGFWGEEKQLSNDMSKRIVYLFTSSGLDDEVNIDLSSAFQLVDENKKIVFGASVKSIFIDGIEKHYGKFSLAIEYPKDVDVRTLTLQYIEQPVGAGLQDRGVNIKTPMKSQDIILTQLDEYAPVIDSRTVYISEGAEYISFSINRDLIQTSRAFKFIVNRREYTNYVYSWSSNYIRFYLYLEGGIGEGPYTITVDALNESTGLIDSFGNKYAAITSESISRIIDPVKVTDAVYSKSSGELKMFLENVAEMMSTHACQFVLAVDGQEYRLKGSTSTFYENNKGEVLFSKESMKAVNFDNASKITLKFAPWMEEKGIAYNDALTDASGKPIQPFEIEVKIEH